VRQGHDRGRRRCRRRQQREHDLRTDRQRLAARHARVRAESCEREKWLPCR
jgi:hypothetical protein